MLAANFDNFETLQACRTVLTASRLLAVVVVVHRKQSVLNIAHASNRISKSGRRPKVWSSRGSTPEAHLAKPAELAAKTTTNELAKSYLSSLSLEFEFLLAG